LAGYIPALAEADPSPFGVAVAAWSRETARRRQGASSGTAFRGLLAVRCICFDPEASTELYTR